MEQQRFFPLNHLPVNTSCKLPATVWDAKLETEEAWSKHQAESENWGAAGCAGKRKQCTVNPHVAPPFSSADQAVFCFSLGEAWILSRQSVSLMACDVFIASFPLLVWKLEWVFREGRTSLSKYYDFHPPTDPNGWQREVAYIHVGWEAERCSDSV